MFHYTYRLDLLETGEYYFGSRSSKVEPLKDSYMGSMKSWKPDKTKLVKTIIRDDFENRQDCMLHERQLIIEHISDLLNKNAYIPDVGFVTVGLGQYIDENGKVFRLSKDDKLVLNGKLKPFWEGKHHSNESKYKMSQSALGRKISDDTKKKMSEFWKGKSKSDTHRKKMSESSKGDNNNYKRYLERTGLPHAKSKPILQFSLNGELIKEWVNGNIASKESGISYKGINNNLRGKTKTSGGFVWKYKD